MDRAGKTLTERDRRTIIDQVAELQAAESISNYQVGRIIGCSTATWSQILNRKYKGDIDKYLLSAAEWIEGRGRREAPVGDYVQTSIGRYVQTICRRAADMPCIGLVVTPSGAGKTAALRDFASRGDRRRIIYIQAGEMASTPKGVITQLSDACGIPNNRSDQPIRRYGRLVEHLAGLHSGGKARSALIIVDEATTLKPNAINMLRNLHDDQTVRAGIVLADTWAIDSELNRRGRMTGGYEQLTSRCGAKFMLKSGEAIPQGDTELIAESILRSLGRTRRLAAASCKYLHRLTAAGGMFRNVLHRLHAVADLAAGSGVEPTYSVAELDFAAGMVGGRCEMPHGSPCPFPAPNKPAAAKRRRTA